MPAPDHATRGIALLLLSMLPFSPPYCSALAAPSPPSGTGRRVVVAGAGGQTGQHVFRKLLLSSGRDRYDPVGIVRSDASRDALLSSTAGGVTVPPESAIVCDISSATPSFLDGIMKDASALVVCTSAKPSPTGDVDEDTGRPMFGFPNGDPERIDWSGQKNLIDAAKRCGVDHVVLCGSMGGTNPNHPLNALGRARNDDGTTGGGGDILKWKRKSEVYLVESGVPYTIVHPGGLLNEPGNERELCVGIDDVVPGTTNNSIPREDVANVMIAALEDERFRNRSFDLVSKTVGDGTVTKDYALLLDSLAGKNCDYSLGEIA